MTWPARARGQALGLAGLALAAGAPGLRNGFVYDDLPLIQQNPLVHDLSSVSAIWSSGYWPNGLLYRPVAVQLYALEWALGGGRPVVFHAVNILLAAVTAVLFWRVARRLLPAAAAWLGAALFAVHPVHVEVVGNAVGQTELLASALGLLVLDRYLLWRDDGFPARRRLLLAGLTLLAILSKETGVVIPLLLATAELLLVRPARGPSWRLGEAVPVLALQALAVAAALLLRVAVLGPTPGAGPSALFWNLPAAHRIVAMLAVVPEWARLLVWPAHLQAEYGPPAVAISATVGPRHALGVALLAAGLGLAWAARRRQPVLAFGLTWAALALLPVSNLLTPTGVVLAERTLFLPSAGAMLALAAAAAALAPERPRVRRALIGGFAALIVLGLARSMTRQSVWRTPVTFVQGLLRDAPTTYRAWYVASAYHEQQGDLAAAERTARRALELYQGDPRVFEHLGQLLRRGRRCPEAVPILAEGVRRFPDQTLVRARLIECRLATGDTAQARSLVEEAIRRGRTEFQLTLRRLDRADAAAARP